MQATRKRKHKTQTKLQLQTQMDHDRTPNQAACIDPSYKVLIQQTEMMGFNVIKCERVLFV